jgi:hypothetical protein
VRVIALVWVFLLAGCGGSVATSAKLTPTPSPTPNVGALYTDAVNAAFDSLKTDYAAIVAAKPGSPDEATAAQHISSDYQAFLDALDKISFPANAADDLSTLKKSLVALQVFWSNVSGDTNSYNSFTQTNLDNANNQAELVLGHDVGVSLVISPLTSPTP